MPTGLTAVLISPASLFIALLAPFLLPSERIDRRQGIGMLLGLAGVVLIVGVESVSTLKEFLGAMAMVGAAFFYGLSSFVVKGKYGKLAAVQTSWISVTLAGLVTLPFGIATTPGHTPDAGAIAALLALGVARHRAGVRHLLRADRRRSAPARAALVSYLAPGVALFYGAIFLDETITVAAIVGLVLILGRRGDRLAAEAVAAPAPSRRWRALPDSVLVSARVDLTLSPAEEEFRDTLRALDRRQPPGQGARG